MDGLSWSLGREQSALQKGYWKLLGGPVHLPVVPMGAKSDDWGVAAAPELWGAEISGIRGGQRQIQPMSPPR